MKSKFSQFLKEEAKPIHLIYVKADNREVERAIKVLMKALGNHDAGTCHFAEDALKEDGFDISDLPALDEIMVFTPKGLSPDKWHGDVIAMLKDDDYIQI
jgi:hypothetical protein